MLRKIIGWICINNEPWDMTMRRMKTQVERALEKYPIVFWKRRIAKYLWKFMLRIKAAPNNSWIQLASNWEPRECNDEFSEYVAHRVRGRPNLRWDDAVNSFCRVHFNEVWQNMSLGVLESSTESFIAYFCNVPVVAEVEIPLNRTIVRSSSVPFFQVSSDPWW